MSKDSGVTIGAKTVDSILQAYDLNNFAMVSDIEGCEIEILLNDVNALKKCRQLIIELHQTSYQNVDYSVADLARIIQDSHHFYLVEHQGPVYYFNRSIKRINE